MRVARALTASCGLHLRTHRPQIPFRETHHVSGRAVALAEARKEAHSWSDSARDLLGGLPEGPARDVLALLCDYVVSRTS